MGCKHCQNGKHGKCVRRNALKTTGCPGNCQHRGTKHRLIGKGTPVGTVRVIDFSEAIRHYERIARGY